ncbi:MAG TPA: glutamate-1-semialdehyde 2,1-aminomutase, partial [Bacteroidia bacterium]|nr:glutamate-1-semialdehyde 2,1-aminomutase [Bacteroidia bacterium]
MDTKKSEALFEKAKSYFPGGVNSPVRAFRSVGGSPLFIEKGKGSHIWDADGNEYIDYCCSWGPLILGHANDKVLNAVDHTMRKGTSFGAPTQLENQLAELILSNNKYLQKIRFVSSGTEAVMSAIRLARGFTHRNKILKFEGCYHGHVDSLLVKAGSGLVTFGNSSSAGVPESFVNETITVPLNNRQAVEKAFEQYENEIACVIIEPVPANNGLLLQGKAFLDFLREITAKNNSLLIFDEVISGFRMGFCGAAGLYDIQPDIVTYGKIIGGGFPVGAYGASAEIMSNISPEGNVYQAGTLSGNPVAMSAGIAQLGECLAEGFYGQLEEKTAYLVNGIN